MKWEGATAVITGASRGIGAAVARRAAAQGARVGLIARSTADLNAVLHDLPGVAAAATADVTDRDQLADALDDLRRQLGDTDILVNSAGLGAYGPFATSSVDEAEQLMRVNYFGAVNAIGLVLPDMLARRRGHIVTVGSISGRVAVPLEATYVATKFAVVGFSEALALELGPHGIGVSIVNPGPVDTDFFSRRGHAYERGFPRQVPADRVARAVIAAVERERAEVAVPRWLRLALVFRTLLPSLSNAGTRRSFRAELSSWEPAQQQSTSQEQTER